MWILSAWLLFVGLVLQPIAGRAGRDRQAGEGILPAWLDIERELLLAVGEVNETNDTAATTAVPSGQALPAAVRAPANDPMNSRGWIAGLLSFPKSPLHPRPPSRPRCLAPISDNRTTTRSRGAHARVISPGMPAERPAGDPHAVPGRSLGGGLGKLRSRRCVRVPRRSSMTRSGTRAGLLTVHDQPDHVGRAPDGVPLQFDQDERCNRGRAPASRSLVVRI